MRNDHPKFRPLYQHLDYKLAKKFIKRVNFLLQFVELIFSNRVTLQKCMTTGMNPSWVLSDEQRKKRFKKYREAGDDTELSPASSQDSEREGGSGGPADLASPLDPQDRGLDSGCNVGRRRAKSAQEPLHCLAGAAGPRYPRTSRLSGPPVCSIAVPVIKMEKDQFEMSPLRDTDCFSFDLNDHKYLEDEAIKIEPEIADLEPFSFNDSLEGLIENYQFAEKEVDIKPDLKSRTEKTGASTAVSQSSSVPAGICLQLSEDDMMHIYKIEMSFENSNNSIPVMSQETSEIWNFISKSCNFSSISQSFTSSLLTEAVEFSLRRNLIFLQENSDFTNLSMRDRKNLYNRNMGSMCHVRAVMQQSNKHDFLVRGALNVEQKNANQNRSSVLNMAAHPNMNHSEHFEISYKNHKTGKIRRWNLMELPFQGIRFEKSYENSNETESLLSGPSLLSGQEENCQKKSLLNLAESLWSLELERTSYLILLLIVLFSSQGGQVDNLRDVDRYQNQYMMLLFR